MNLNQYKNCITGQIEPLSKIGSDLVEVSPREVFEVGDDFLNDRSYQRKEVWTSEKKGQYVASIFENEVGFVNIVIADMHACLENTSLEKTAEHFQEKIEEGGRYLIIDGQNRIAAIRDFINGEVRCDNFKLERNYQVKAVQPQKFMALSPALKDYFLHRERLSFKVITKIQQGQIQKIFRKINAGLPLKDQEKRNALPQAISDYIRERAGSRFKKISQIPYGDKRIKRRADEELLAQVAASVKELSGDLSGTFQVNQKQLWSFYQRKARDVPRSFKNLTKNELPDYLSEFESLMEECQSVLLTAVRRKNYENVDEFGRGEVDIDGSPSNQGVTSGPILNYIFFTYFLLNRGYSINNDAEYLSWVLNIHYEMCENSQGPNQAGKFYSWSRANKNYTAMNKRIKKMWDRFEEEKTQLLDNGIIERV